MSKPEYKTMSLYEKLLEVQKSTHYLQKENKGSQYSYVSGTQAVVAIRSKMDDLGLILKTEIISQEVNERTYEKADKYSGPKQMIDYFTKVSMRFTWINVDKPDEKDESYWQSQGVDIAGEKGIGKAATYGEKYFILKYFHIATDTEDPDRFQAANDIPTNPEPAQPKKITLEQKEELGKIMKAKGISQGDARNIMLESTKKDVLNNLTFDEGEILKKEFNNFKAPKPFTQ